MNPKAFEITADSRLKEISYTSLDPNWTEDDKYRWLDFSEGTRQEWQKLLVSLEIETFIEQSGITFGDGSRFDVFAKALYLEFPMLTGEQDQWTTQVSIICLGTTILTFHKHPIEVGLLIANFTTGLRRLQEATTSGLLYGILDQYSDRIAQSINPARAEARRLANALEKDPDSVKNTEIMTLKDHAGELVDVLEDVTYCVTRLQTVETSTFNAQSLAKKLRDLSATLVNAQHTAERFERRTSNLHLRYTLIQQEKTNSRLQALTIISAIFLPLTLIVGVYGMNFDVMPELHWAYGYPAVLILMVVIVIGLLSIFKNKGWFD